MFARSDLTEAGFLGFIPVRVAMRGRILVPDSPGLYAVLIDPPTGSLPLFLDASVGGRFKGKDPTVSAEALEDKFNPGVGVQYIGRAGNLERRIKALLRFAGGEPVGHWGGRYLWQLTQCLDLLIAWRPEPDPVTAEAALLDEFEMTVGRLPFANLIRGHRRLQLH